MSERRSPSERITAIVTSWPGVEAGYGKRGEWGFRFGGRQIGHLHGDRAAHFAFTRELGEKLRAEGRVGPHPVFPDSPKMAARAIDGEEDIADVVALMLVNYERIAGRAPSVFEPDELGYLHGERRLGRIATVGRDATPHVVPVGWRHNIELDTIDVGGHSLEETKKFQDVARSGRAAIVIDDVASVSPWRARGIEVRGRAEAVRGEETVIRIHPERVVSWGLGAERSARTVAGAAAAAA